MCTTIVETTRLDYTSKNYKEKKNKMTQMEQFRQWNIGDTKRNYFHYGDNVVVTEGFYKGQKGKIIDTGKSAEFKDEHHWLWGCRQKMCWVRKYYVDIGEITICVDNDQIDKIKKRKAGRPKGARNRK